jgi:fructoselysine-6-P-deglycase FrlB-like protein
MGRPFASELEAVADTFAWARTLDVGLLVDAVRRTQGLPLAAVGSGGSLSAATFCADLHQRLTGRLARVMTPLELVSLGGLPTGAAGVLFTAGGRNKDIRVALDVSLAGEPSALTLVTATAGNPASTAARLARYPVVVDFPPPSGRDGFLATNSLVMFFAVTYRAYHAAGLVADALPETWERVSAPETLFGSPLIEMLAGADTMLVLHGVDTRAAAVDLESKCSEAALAHVQLADYRNFAHGRHHWLAKRPSTVVLSLESPADSAIAMRTLRLLPPAIRVVRVRGRHAGPLAALEALGAVFHIVQTLGAERGIDPGRPGVPEFGGKLYSLGAITCATPPRVRETRAAHAAVAISRKARVPLARVGTLETRTLWERAYARALATLGDATYAGLVLDYDGTLADASDRFAGPNAAVTDALTRLLKAGVPIGVATGRGKSVGRDLRARISNTLWPSVLIGYYNGGEVARLDDETAPDGRAEVTATLGPIYDALLAVPQLLAAAEITPRLPQITVEAHVQSSAEFVWDLVTTVIADLNAPGVRVVRSSHSMDVLAPGVGKQTVATDLRAAYAVPEGLPLLHVGDRGQWPGNDAELLRGLHAVSVDETAANPTNAWNLARPGTRGVAATLDLVAALRPEAGCFRVDVDRVLDPSGRTTR